MSGRAYEGIKALVEDRPRAALYHSALEIRIAGRRYIVESAPVNDAMGTSRGVVAEGPVGTRRAGRLRLFRYEIRRWPGGTIDDIADAAARIRVTDDPVHAQRILDVLPLVPTPVWGRDEWRTGDMWNSNSVTSWSLVRAGIEVGELQPPAGGRAPGWDAGLIVARRQAAEREGLAADPAVPR